MFSNVETRYIIQRDGHSGLWVCFSIVEHSGKTFKNWVGAGKTKADAEAIKAKARAASQ